MANLFDEDRGEEFLRAGGGKINLAGIAAVATPQAGHVRGGKSADRWEEGKVGPTEGGDALKGSRPV
jgi:hypothetical protein